MSTRVLFWFVFEVYVYQRWGTTRLPCCSHLFFCISKMMLPQGNIDCYAHNSTVHGDIMVLQLGAPKPREIVAQCCRWAQYGVGTHIWLTVKNLPMFNAKETQVCTYTAKLSRSIPILLLWSQHRCFRPVLTCAVRRSAAIRTQGAASI